MTDSGVTTPPPSAFSIFRNRNFTLMWLAQLVSEMGTSLVTLASSIFVYQLTGSALNVGLMMMASMAPSLLVGLVAGVFVDRYDRKQIMVAADLLRAVLIVAIPILLPLNIAWLYILVALTAAVGQFFNPAHSSVLPEIASEEELNAANSLMAISSFGALIVGYAAAGLITSQFSVTWAYYVNAFSFLIAGLLISRVRVPKLAVDEKTSVAAVFHNLRTGLNIVTSTPILRSLFLVFIPIFIAFGLGNALRLPFSVEVLGATEFEFSLIESVTLVGFVAASIVMAQLGDRLREGQWITISFIGIGFTSIAFALNSSIPLALVIITIEGFVNSPSVIARALIIQRYTPREARGRVFSAFFVSRDTLFMIGMALAGLGDFFDLRLLYLAAGIITLLFGLLSLVLPGLGQPAAEWRRALSLLRTADSAPGLGAGRLLQPADIDRLVALVPIIGSLNLAQRSRLQAEATIHEVPKGTAVLRRHEAGDEGYFILDGQAIAGWQEDGQTHVLETLGEGDFFGEIAVLAGLPRTADVITEESSTLIKVPARLLREMAAEPQLNRLFMSRMTERMLRMNLIDLPRTSQMNQAVLRDLREAKPEIRD